MGSPKSGETPLYPPASSGRRGRGTAWQRQALRPGPFGIEICIMRPVMLTEQKNSTASSPLGMDKYLSSSFPDLNLAGKGCEK